jgi:GTP cyclohydrolase II
MIVKLAEGTLKTKYGAYRELLFYDGQKETVVMLLGDVEGAEDVLCRVHSSCIFGHYFDSLECTCRAEMIVSQQLIQQAGKGILILLDQEGKGNGHFALLKSIGYKRKGFPQADAYEAVGFKRDARDFTIAAKVLKHIGVKSIRLLTDNSNKMASLVEQGIDVIGIKKIE